MVSDEMVVFTFIPSAEAEFFGAMLAAKDVLFARDLLVVCDVVTSCVYRVHQ